MSESTEVADAQQGAAEENDSSAAAVRYRRRLVGRVASNKMDKTAVVEVVRFKMHPMYRKYVRVRKRYKAHDERNECQPGDRVELVEHRRLSRDKRFRVSRIIERAVQA